MSGILTTYSGKDLNFAFTSPLTGTIQVAGVSEQGVNKVSVRMAQTQTTMKVGMDGAVVPSAIPGDNGEIDIDVWQTSTIHQLLLAAYNAQKAARDQGDVSNWAANTIVIQNIVDGSGHQATGVAFMKVPDKVYETEAQAVTWTLMCANIVNS